MNAAGRLGLYATGVVAAFACAFGVAAAVVPGGATAAQNQQAPQDRQESDMNGHDAVQGSQGHGDTHEQATAAGGQGAHGGHEAAAPAGLSLSAAGLTLSPLTAPDAVGVTGELSFRILGADGEAVTAYEESHDKELHLMAVRTDGTGFRHVHPVLDPVTGAWALPWTWDAAGTYRVYADFAPAGGEKVTLSRTIDVAGAFTPVIPAAAATASVDGFDVSIAGDLVAGSTEELTVTVERDGVPVTSLQPYLGAFGHLVALREGDLAYLHVHAEGDEPAEGDVSGPEIVFAAQAPTAGRYLLYLDFQVDGVVHTASFVLEAHAAGHAH